MDENDFRNLDDKVDRTDRDLSSLQTRFLALEKEHGEMLVLFTALAESMEGLPDLFAPSANSSPQVAISRNKFLTAVRNINARFPSPDADQ